MVLHQVRLQLLRWEYLLLPLIVGRNLLARYLLLQQGQQLVS